jgi:hypothetical protein
MERASQTLMLGCIERTSTTITDTVGYFRVADSVRACVRSFHARLTQTTSQNWIDVHLHKGLLGGLLFTTCIQRTEVQYCC